MKKVFDIENIYSKQNPIILEELLDRGTVSFDELLVKLNVQIANSDQFLLDLISPGEWTHDHLNHDEMLREHYIPNFGEEGPRLVYVDKILPLMIRKNVLPREIVRLPRRDSASTNSQGIDDYYEHALSYEKSTIDEIIFHSINYSDIEPLALTYHEALARLEARGQPQSLLKKQATQLKILTYVAIAENSIKDDVRRRECFSQSIEIFRDQNCGNPLYLKRYKGLEALMPIDITSIFEGRIVQINDNTDCLRKLKVQSTDLESKFHLHRSIVSCVQFDRDGSRKYSTEFSLNDVLYLADDIDALILQAEQTSTCIADKVYKIELSVAEIALTKKQLEVNPSSTKRIHKQFQHHHDQIKEKHPKMTIHKSKVARVLQEAEKPIYEALRLKQPKDYLRYTRARGTKTVCP